MRHPIHPQAFLCFFSVPVEEPLDVLLDDDPAVPEPLPAQLLHVGDLPRAEEQLRLPEPVTLLVVDQLLRRRFSTIQPNMGP